MLPFKKKLTLPTHKLFIKAHLFDHVQNFDHFDHFDHKIQNIFLIKEAYNTKLIVTLIDSLGRIPTHQHDQSLVPKRRNLERTKNIDNIPVHVNDKAFFLQFGYKKTV